MPKPNERPNNFDAPLPQEDMFPEKPPKNWLETLRLYLRDIAEKNILLNQDEESDAKQLELAFAIALNDWNSSSPRLTTVTYHTHPWRTGLLYRAAIEVIRSVSICMMRNELDYQDGDETYQINNQYRSMLAWSNELLTEYNAGKQRVKTELNSSNAWGGSASEYSWMFPNLNRSSVHLG